MAAVLTINDLRVDFETYDGEVSAVRGVSLEIGRGETLGVVGESGSGKSQTFMAVMGLLARNGRASGSAHLHGQNLLTLSPRELNRVRAHRCRRHRRHGGFQSGVLSGGVVLDLYKRRVLRLRSHCGLQAGCPNAHNHPSHSRKGGLPHQRK